ncbi:MAG: dTMP kinase [Chloroflexi bacterium]|jgi:dTMP kinase|nr:dTMP kinase [Anaerolineaceae bacterium]NLI44721.1 dTMP kinase [Chloroflexota bacterium]HOE34970.1 dTMP kinase [Anaerolineaceae bacterium]HOT25509.1 dTMP kinase [Anaerolineaceae bacterium]HQH58135.1 dTMP kinase [Anaerolineaceae bacterium]
MFITLEGPEGSGKTSQIRELAAYVESLGYEVLTTREPGGTDIGDQIRQVLVRLENQGLHPRTEILLFLAARAQLVEQVIKPALSAGKVVLCDRYGDSTLAYQGYGHGLDLSMLRSMLAFATDQLKPDLTLLLDLDVETGLQRKRKEAEWNRLDAYEVAFHQRVRAGYLELCAQEPERWRVIDAGAPKEAVQLAMREAVARFINENSKKPLSAPQEKGN